MDRKAALATVERFREVLERRGIRVSRVILYGSFARGDAHDGSDIDVVVLSDDFAGRSYWQRVDLLTDAVYELFAPIEAVAMTPAEWAAGASLVVDYARDGEVVFAA